MGEGAAHVVPLRGEAPFRASGNVPHSVQAEQALLGAIMVNNRSYDELEGCLQAEHFYVPMHAVVFEAIDAIIDARGGEANPITIAERLRGSLFNAEQALFPHLTKIFENASLTADAKSVAEVIITAFRQRQLMGLAENLHTRARAASKPEDVEVMLEAVGSEVFRLTEVGGSKSVSRGMRENLLEVIRHAEAAKASGTGVTGIATGFLDLDKLLSGLQPSDLIILGARPSMGKTSLLINIAQAVSGRHLRGEPNSSPVAVFSLEMSAHQLTQRILSGASNIGAQQLGNGQLSDGDFMRVAREADALQHLPLHIDDTPGLSISALRARARQMKRKHGIGLIIVDYLQLLTAPAKGGANVGLQFLG